MQRSHEKEAGSQAEPSPPTQCMAPIRHRVKVDKALPRRGSAPVTPGGRERPSAPDRAEELGFLLGPSRGGFEPSSEG